MDYKDYYKILGVSRSADEKEIKRAFRKLARQYHPDQNPDDPAAEDKFKDINEAYEVLGNADNRQKYDTLGANYKRYQQMGGGMGDFGDFMGGGQNVNLDDLFGGGAGGMGDFFSTIFGSGMGGPNRTQPLRRDTEQEIEITLEEAYTGSQRTLVDENGTRFTVKIPKGAKTGTKVRLRGKGGHGGDLYLVIRVRPHSEYTRDENDDNTLYRTVELDLLTAVLGGKVTVDTLKGSGSLKILPGTQGGKRIRLRGRGMPDLRQNDSYGDLIAEIQIRVPSDLSDKERELYEQLRDLRE